MIGKHWRPEEWDSHDYLLHPKGCDCGLCRTYEAGADAMLESLRKQWSDNHVDKGDDGKPGVYVFIPDD